jgi:putative Holliday junction resolvase
MFAQPHGTFAPDEALDELASLHAEDGIATLVVGWPLTEDGEAGAATDFVQDYLDRLTERLPDVPWVKQDERYTSEWALNALRRAGVKQPGRYDKGRVDAAAAAVILQLYLDAQKAT